jgi:hypothetical protein
MAIIYCFKNKTILNTNNKAGDIHRNINVRVGYEAVPHNMKTKEEQS